MKIELKKRKLVGKGARSLRNQGKIPASVYGPKTKPQNVTLDLKTFEKAFGEAGHSKVIDLIIEGQKKGEKALIREVQSNPITDEITHASFFVLDLKKPITTEVPVVTKGVSQAVKDSIGFLVTPLEALEVRCLPEKLPSELVIDISNLNEIGDSIPVSELNLPKGVELTAGIGENATLAYIAPPQKEIVEEVEEPEAEEGEEAEGEEAVEGEEVEGEEKAEGEEKEGEEKVEEEAGE